MIIFYDCIMIVSASPLCCATTQAMPNFPFDVLFFFFHKSVKHGDSKKNIINIITPAMYVVSATYTVYASI